MIDQKSKGSMQRNSVASLRCLQGKAFSSNLQDRRTPVEGSEAENEVKAQTGSIAVKHFGHLGSESFAFPCETYQVPIYQQDIMFLPDIQRLQLNQLNGFDSQFYSMNNSYALPVENQYQYVPPGMFYQGYPYDLQFQEFQYFVVIDFEATCDKERNPNPQEIIEFPSVLVNSMTGQLEASFQTYVRPAYHQNLTDFCKELTGIKQIQVDRGVSLSDALLMHDKWLADKGIKNTKFAVVTWSNWDCRVMLENECRLKNIQKPPYFNRWINLKVPFLEMFGGVLGGERCNLKMAVQLAGLVWEGRAHCGLDDARNTARLLSNLMHRGFKFSITNQMIYQSADQSIPLQQRQADGSLTSAYYPYQLKNSPVSLAQSFVGPGKDHQSSVPTGLKVANAPVKSQVRIKIEAPPVVPPGLAREVAYALTPKAP